MRRVGGRALAYLVAGAAATLGLHAAFLMLYDPLDPAADRAAPLHLRRPVAGGEATILFAGDTAEADAALPTLEEQGFEYPFSATVDLVRDADLAVVNIEAPITDGGRAFPIYKDYLYRAPARSAAALAWAGFDVLQMANNHATDYGASGIADTIANATRHGMAVIGAGLDGASARRGLVAELGDVKVGLLAYCENQFLWRVYVGQFAGRGHPGVAAAQVADLRKDIARLRPMVDVLVVSFHMGLNYAPPSPETIAWSRRAIDLGADLVVNHHPHVADPLMMHRGRPIVLSLGNYAFGTPGFPELDYGWLALARIAGRRLERLEIIPLNVQNQEVRFRPRPLPEAELGAALERLRAQSAPLGADVRIEGGRGVLHLSPAGAS